jgi:hypothetical protein
MTAAEEYEPPCPYRGPVIALRAAEATRVPTTDPRQRETRRSRFAARPQWLR